MHQSEYPYDITLLSKVRGDIIKIFSTENLRGGTHYKVGECNPKRPIFFVHAGIANRGMVSDLEKLLVGKLDPLVKILRQPANNNDIAIDGRALYPREEIIPEIHATEKIVLPAEVTPVKEETKEEISLPEQAKGEILPPDPVKEQPKETISQPVIKPKVAPKPEHKLADFLSFRTATKTVAVKKHKERAKAVKIPKKKREKRTPSVGFKPIENRVMVLLCQGKTIEEVCETIKIRKEIMVGSLFTSIAEKAGIKSAGEEIAKDIVKFILEPKSIR